MPDITFTISTATRDLLRQVAYDAGYRTLDGTQGNIKAMTRANWAAGIQALKQKAIDDARPQVDMSDVNLGTGD